MQRLPTLKCPSRQLPANTYEEDDTTGQERHGRQRMVRPPPSGLRSHSHHTTMSQHAAQRTAGLCLANERMTSVVMTCLFGKERIRGEQTNNTQDVHNVPYGPGAVPGFGL